MKYFFQDYNFHCAQNVPKKNKKCSFLEKDRITKVRIYGHL